MGLSGPHIIDGRYAIYDEIASGGMATVHFGCSLGAASFSRLVAIKRLHAHLAREHEFVTMFLDEARVAARIRHPNVAPTLDVVATDREIFLVMEYVHGESLSRLLAAMRARRVAMPLPVAAAVIMGLLGGLHAAHEATDERGVSLQIVHRDVSPQNLIVGADGVARIVDFGVAKAVGRLQQTQTGEIKGKFGYMAPEQVNGAQVTRAADIYAAGVLLWETLTGTPLFTADSDVALAAQVLLGKVSPPSHRMQGVPAVLDDIVMCALERDPARRFATARDMARAIETTVPVANASHVAAWVEDLAAPVLRRREQRLSEIESDWAGRTGSANRQRLAARSPERSRPSAQHPPQKHEAQRHGLLPRSDPQRHDAQRDASTRAVTYAAGAVEGTRVEGPHRARRDPSSLSDSQDREEAAQAHASRRLGVWVAIATVATLAAVAIVDRRDDVQDWFRHATASTTSPPTAATPTSSTAGSLGSRQSGAASPTPAPIAVPSAAIVSGTTPFVVPAPITVSVETLPIAAPPSVPIESLPHAAGTASDSNVSMKPPGLHARPRR
jgi:eukaryotic-like serine/threonine-protein kinase